MRPLLPIIIASFPLTLAIGHMRAQSGPAAHALGSSVARSTTTFLRIGAVVSQSDGRVFVADASARVLWLLDPMLANGKVVLDSAQGRANSFSTNSFLMPFRGDSALFFDRAAGVLLAIDPNGGLGRTFAPPAGPTGFDTRFGPGLTSSLMSGPVSTRSSIHETGPLGTSGVFGLVYRLDGDAPPVPPIPGPGQAPVIQRYDDSLMVMRWNFDTRRVDIVARLSTGRTYIRFMSADSARTTPARNQFVFYDDAVVTSDGSIALFHAHDYRIDWVGPDGRTSVGSRIPFLWRRITDDDRARIVDSANTRTRQMIDSALAKRAADSARTGSPPMTTQYSFVDGVSVARQVPQSLPRAPAPVVPEDVPDFYAPTGRAAVLADADNHVWIKQAPASADRTAPAIWDVIDRAGALIERVAVPPTETVVGFAPGGFVFTTAIDAGKLTLIKHRAR